MRRFAPYGWDAAKDYWVFGRSGEGNPSVGLAIREAQRRRPAFAWLAALWFEGEYESPHLVWDGRRYERQERAYYEVMGLAAIQRQLALADLHPKWESEVGILVEAPPPEPHPTRQPKMALAFKLLRDELRQGERPAVEILAAAEAAGVSKRTLKEAKKVLGVEDTRHRFGGPVFWRPPRRIEVRWVSRRSFLRLAKYEQSKARSERRRAAKANR